MFPLCVLFTLNSLIKLPTMPRQKWTYMHMCIYWFIWLFVGLLASVKMDVPSPQGTDTTCRSWRANCRSSSAGGDTWKLQRGTAALKWAVLSDLSRWVYIMELAPIQVNYMSSMDCIVQYTKANPCLYLMGSYKHCDLAVCVQALF